MALPLANTFEGGTNATAISAANSGGASGDAFDSTVGTAPTFSSTQKAHGALSESPATAAQSMVQWAASIGTPTEIWIRCYCFINANPSVNVPFVYCRDQTNAANNAGVRLTTARVLGVTANGSTNVVAFTNVPALTTWFRVELHCQITGGNVVCDGRYFASMDSGLATETATTTQATTHTSFGAVRFGANVASTGALFLDDVAVNGTGWPGPSLFPVQQPMIQTRAAMRAAIW